MIDHSIITQVANSADIVEIIGEHVCLKRAGKNFLGLCPFHQEKTPSFSVSPTKGIFKCFGCGAGGSVFQFLMRKERLNFPEAVRTVAQRLGITIAEQESSPADRLKTDLANINQWAADLFRSNLLDEHKGKTAREYLARRGLTPEIQEKFKLGLALPSWENLIQAASSAGWNIQSLDSAGLITARSTGQGHYDRFRNRLIFPIIDAAQRVVGFAGRILDPADPKSAKYLNSPETPLFNKSFCLYGLDQARQAIIHQSQAIVVEGYTDCLMAHQNGIANVVATMGTALTNQHAAMLRRFCEHVVVVFDSDQAGQQATDRALDVFLRQSIQLSVARVPEGEDPCDYIYKQGPKAFQNLIAQAVDALQYKWQLTRQAHEDADTPLGKRRAVEQFLSALANSAQFGSSDPLARGILVNHIAKLISVSPADVLATVNRIKLRSAERRTEDLYAQDSSPAPQIISNAMDKALHQVLQVLLNKPAYIEKVTEVIGPDDFSDPDLRTVAGLIFKWISQSDNPRLADLLADHAELAQADLITSLAQEGESKGNFQGNLAGALDCIAGYRRIRQLQQAAACLRQDQPDLSDQQTNEMLAKVQSQLRVKNPRNPGVTV